MASSRTDQHAEQNTAPTQISVFAEDAPPSGVSSGEHDSSSFLLKLDSFEGPIDLLLQLARDQKVDLAKISILQLARQYIAFIDQARLFNLDLAAEYLVMAAWLAYLKSRLLLPKDEKEEDEPSAEMMAEALAYQLKRLEATQNSAKKLAQRYKSQLMVYGRAFKEKFDRPEPDKYAVDLYQLLKAYGDITQRKNSSHYKPIEFDVMSMEDALERLQRLLGRLPKSGNQSVWTTLTSFMPEQISNPLFARSSIASLLTASLEMAKQGKVELRQDSLFRPIYVRAVDKPPVFEDETMPQQTSEVSQ
jgi:segregation and condensation protein A